MLALTLSATPRRFTMASSSMNPIAIAVVRPRTHLDGSPLALDDAGEGRQVRGEGAGGGRGRGDTRAHDGEADQERDEVDAERLVRVERRTGGLRILRHQLQIGERGDHRHDERHQEGQPDDPADLFGHVARDRVDPGTEDVADDEQQQQLGPHHPLELGLVPRGVNGLGGRTLAHRSCAPSDRDLAVPGCAGRGITLAYSAGPDKSATGYRRRSTVRQAHASHSSHRACNCKHCCAEWDHAEDQATAGIPARLGRRVHRVPTSGRGAVTSSAGGAGGGLQPLPQPDRARSATALRRGPAAAGQGAAGFRGDAVRPRRDPGSGGPSDHGCGDGRPGRSGDHRATETGPDRRLRLVRQGERAGRDQWRPTRRRPPRTRHHQKRDDDAHHHPQADPGPGPQGRRSSPTTPRCTPSPD